MAIETAKIKEVDTGNYRLSDSLDREIRLLIYSHDTFGLGHLQRCLKISRVLSKRFPSLSILLVTGSPVSHRFEFPPRVDYVKLPSVRKAGPEKYEARTLTTAFEMVLKLRSELLLKSVQSFRPHFFLADHSPIGMKGELLPALNWLKTRKNETVSMLGLRDIIDAPEAVTALWKEQGIYDVMESMYDHILVYGSPSIYDPVSAYQFSAALKQKTHFCNYIGETAENSIKTAGRKKTSRKRPLVVVTIGGGDCAGETVIGNYLKMLQKNRADINFDSVIITGPFLEPELYDKYQKASRNLPVSIKGFMSSTGSLLKRSDLVIATGGYNTITDILCHAKRAIVIPRVMHRQEQRIRASRLAELGVLEYLPPEQVTPELLYSRLRRLLDNPAEPVADARVRNLIELEGASRLADFFGTILEAQGRLKAGKI